MEIWQPWGQNLRKKSAIFNPENKKWNWNALKLASTKISKQANQGNIWLYLGAWGPTLYIFRQV